MKLWIYEPYNWDYCGGAVIVVASSAERAEELILQYQKKEHNQFYPELSFSPYRVKHSLSDGNCWELTHTLDLHPLAKLKEEVIVYNYNYA